MAVFTDIAALQPFAYRAIMADPPWSFDNWSEKGETKNAKRHYDCMTLAEIAAVPVGPLAHGDGAALFMWVTDPFFLETPDLEPQLGHRADCSRSPVGAVMKAWGFRFVTVAFHWVKASKHGAEHLGPGYWTRANPEICLLGIAGAIERQSKGVRRLIEAPGDGPDTLYARVREHSRKPDAIRARVEQLVDGPYLELFSRTDRAGWDCWGNQAGKFSASAEASADTSTTDTEERSA